MPSDLGQEELKPVADPEDGRPRGRLPRPPRDLLLRSCFPHLEPVPLELAGELLDVGVGELVLDGERLELGRLDQPRSSPASTIVFAASLSSSPAS